MAIEHTTPATVRRYVGRALVKGSDGRYRPTRSDRLTRSLRFLTPEGVTTVKVRSSRTASRIAEHWAAVNRYLKTGETDELRKFEGQSLRVAGAEYKFVTDPFILDRLANAGEVSFEDLYDLTT